MRLVILLVPLSAILLTCQGQEVSDQCLLDVNKVVTAAQDGELWALHMLDSSTKIPDGILYGNIDQLGNYEECIQAGTPEFHGLYCRVMLQIATSTPVKYSKQIADMLFQSGNTDINRVDLRAGELILRAAVCAPSSCSFLDIQFLVEKYAPLLLAATTGGPPPNVTAHVDPLYCTDGGPVQPFGWSGWTLSALVVVMVAAMLVATVLDWRNPQHNSTWLKILSVRTSTAQLLSCKLEPGSMGCLHGLRALSMAWIILGHRYENYAYTPTSNAAVAADKIYRRPLFMSVGNALLAVDTFFFLSGLLLCFVFMREMQRTGKFNLIKFYSYRYFRLTMPIAIVILFYIVFVIHMGYGPNWKSTMYFWFPQCCTKNWWTTILYINNYYDILQPCVSQTWYTSVDMQLAWLSPLVLLPLYFAPSAGLQLLTLLTAISCFIPFTVTYLNNYPWNSITVEQDYYDIIGWLKDIYFPTHTRATSYLAGIVVGHYLSIHRNKPLNITKRALTFGWILCTATCLTIVYSFAIPFQEDYEYEPVLAAFYAGFHRLGWSFGLAWIVITCVKGGGGPVNAVLAWPGFQPFSKLTYAAYLTHIAVLLGNIASFQTTGHNSSYEVVRGYFGDLPIVLLISALLYIFVEVPTITILRQILRGDNKSKKPETKEGGKAS